MDEILAKIEHLDEILARIMVSGESVIAMASARMALKDIHESVKKKKIEEGLDGK